MEVKESEFRTGWVGFYFKDEDGHLDEDFSLDKDRALKLARDILNYLTKKEVGKKSLDRGGAD